MSVWDRLIGQPQVIAQLQRAAAEKTPTHAWLFTSPPGAGRQTAALSFAAALLCDQEDPAQRGCGHCKSCITVQSGTHADLTHFTTENLTIRIDEARDLVNKAQDRPLVGRWRVMLIDDAQRMPERTSNVLLKAIEEPPPHTIWLLSAPSPHDVLVTIRSRCRPVALRTPQTQDILADLIGAGVERDLAQHIASLSQGNLELARYWSKMPKTLQRREEVGRMPLSIRSLSDAMWAAYQLIDAAEKESKDDAQQRNDVDKEKLLSSLGVAPDEKLTPTVRAQLRRLEDDQKRRAKRIQTDTLDRFLIDIQSVFRDVLSLQLDSGVPLINHYLGQKIIQFAQRTSAEDTVRHLDTVAKTRQRIKTNAVARLAFEAMMASFMQK